MARRTNKALSSTREYRVLLTTWETYEIVVRAADAASASDLGEATFYDSEPDNFTICDSGNDVLYVELVKGDRL